MLRNNFCAIKGEVVKNNVSLLEGSVLKSLIRLLLPQLGGFFAVTAFNFADSWFVSQLDNSLPEHADSLYLSSISMTFPVVFGIGSIAIGLGIAVTTLISRAHGSGNRELAKRLGRDSLILTMLFTLIVTTLGLFTIDPVFTFMGAKPEQLPIIRSFMTIWYSGAVFMLIPMTCNNVLRGVGNTFWPGLIMTTGAVLNVILDPILIFGLGKIPALGVEGAAIATVVARVTTAITAFTLVVKWDLISLKRPQFSEMIHEWKELLFYALPGIAGKVSMPIGMFVIVVITSTIGKNAVAAISAGSRIDQLVLMSAMALSMVLMIFVSQNLAAGHKDRAREAITWAYKIIVVYSIICSVLIVIFSNNIAVWFNSIKGVQVIGTYYFLITPIVYAFVAVGMMAQQCFFAIQKPMISGLVDIVKFLCFLIPAAWLGSHLYGYKGLIGGLVIANIFVSIVTILLFEYQFRKYGSK